MLVAAYGYGVTPATLALAPVLVGMVAMVAVGMRRLSGRSVRRTLAVGLALAGALCGLTALTRATGFYPLLAVLLFAFGAVMIACNTAWTFVFLRSIDDAMIGVRTGISNAVYQLGSVAGSTVAGVLLATIGLTDYARLLQAVGASPAQMDQALAAFNALLAPNTPDPAGLDPTVAAGLIASYELVYLASYERVLVIIAIVCVVGAAVAWFGLRTRAGRAEVTFVVE